MMAIPKNEGDFNRVVAAGRKRIGGAAAEVTFWAKAFLEAYQAARLAIEKNRSPLFDGARTDARRLFERLLYPGFYRTTPWEWLREYPRYFKGVAARYEGILGGKSATDRLNSAELASYWARYDTTKAREEDAGIFDSELETFRWMLEEYAVSLYAQKLGTSVKVSAVRLEKQWEKTAAAR